MHKQMSKFFIAFLAFLLSVPAVAEDQVLAKLFAQQGIDGTIIISSLHSGKTFTYNNPRASQKFSTASTFKILNALISLEEKGHLWKRRCAEMGRAYLRFARLEP
jgi:beta-lactamase class D